MTKRLIMTLLMATVSLAMFAQKGRHQVGIGVEFAPEMVDDHVKNAVGIKVKYQYGLSDIFRIEPSYTYYAIKEGNGFDNIHWLGAVQLKAQFLKNSRVQPLMFLGADYVSKTYEGPQGVEEDASKFGIRAGIGIDARLSYNWNLQAEFGYSSSIVQALGHVGVTYCF